MKNNKTHIANAFDGIQTKETLRLNFHQDWALVWHCTDDTYDGAPDAGIQAMGSGSTPGIALDDYFANNDIFTNTDYIISGRDFK